MCICLCDLHLYYYGATMCDSAPLYDDEERFRPPVAAVAAKYQVGSCEDLSFQFGKQVWVSVLFSKNEKLMVF